ncbi:MAG: hypothetical protein KDA63_01535, partial [Planctomycetales bacterium]|nr:hypothetical protein [Planctomycetales bacterium]
GVPLLDEETNEWSELTDKWLDDVFAADGITLVGDWYNSSFEHDWDSLFADFTTAWSSVTATYNANENNDPTLTAFSFSEAGATRLNPTISGTIDDDGIVDGLLVEFLIDVDGMGNLMLDGSTTTDATGGFDYTFQHQSTGDEPFVIRVHEPIYDSDATRTVDFESFGASALELNIGTDGNFDIVTLVLKSSYGSGGTTYADIPTLVGAIDVPSDPSMWRVEFDVDGDGRADGYTFTDNEGGFELTADGITGVVSGDVAVSVGVRVVEQLEDATTGATYTTFGPWSTTGWTAVKNVAPSIIDLELALDTGPLYTSGEEIRDLATTDPTIIGRLTDSANVAFVTVQFDHDGDEVIDGTTMTDESGFFRYEPTGLTPGYWDIRARVEEYDANSGETLDSGWHHVTGSGIPIVGTPTTGDVYGISLVPPTPAAVTSLTQTDSNSPTVEGTVTDSDTVTNVVVDVFLDDGVNEKLLGSTRVEADGSFEFTPLGLDSQTDHDLIARAREWDFVNQNWLGGGSQVALEDFNYSPQGIFGPALELVDDGDSLLRRTIKGVIQEVDADWQYAAIFKVDGNDRTFITTVPIETEITYPNGPASSETRPVFTYEFALDPSAASIRLAAQPFGTDDIGGEILTVAGLWGDSTLSEGYIDVNYGDVDAPTIDSGWTIVGDVGSGNTADPTVDGQVDAMSLPTGYDVADIEFEFDLNGDGEVDDVIVADSQGGFRYTFASAQPGPLTANVRAVRFHSYEVPGENGLGATEVIERIAGEWTTLSLTLLDTTPRVTAVSLVTSTGLPGAEETTDPTITGEVTSDDGRSLAGTTVEIDENEDGVADGRTIVLLDEQVELNPDDDIYVFEYTPRNLR